MFSSGYRNYFRGIRFSALKFPKFVLRYTPHTQKGELQLVTSVLLMMTYFGVRVTSLVSPVLDNSICKINYIKKEKKSFEIKTP